MLTNFKKNLLQLEMLMIKHEINELISCLNNYELMNFDIAHQSLEEIFMQFYGGNQHVQ